MNNNYLLRTLIAFILSSTCSLAGAPLLSGFHSDNYEEQFEKVYQTSLRITELSDEDRAALQGTDKQIDWYFNLCESYINGYLIEGNNDPKGDQEKHQKLWLSLLKEHGEDVLKKDFYLFLHLFYEGAISIGLKSNFLDREDVQNEDIEIYKIYLRSLLLARAKVLAFFNSSFNEKAFLEENKFPEEKENLKNFVKNILNDAKREREAFIPLIPTKKVLYKKLDSLSLSDIDVMCDLS